MNSLESDGRGVSVGIVDTIIRLPEKENRQERVRQSADFSPDLGRQEVWSHGYRVFDILSTTTKNATSISTESREQKTK